MKKLVSRVAAAWSKLPAGLRTEGVHVALVFVVTFVSVAAPALPDLVDQLQLGTPPSLSTLRALFVASASAALKATIPVVRVAVVALVSKYANHIKEKKALKAAVQEYLAAKAAEKAAAEAARLAPNGG